MLKPDYCKSCVGWAWSHKGFSIVSGSGEIPLLVCAEASGRSEELLGRPLIESAPAGGVFQRALDMAGVSRDVLSLTNILRCRPPNNELRGMPYERAAIDHCSSYLDQVVKERKPRFILALGDTPLRELSLTEGSISSLRGFILPSKYGVPMIATWHPSFLARGAMHLFGAFLHDIKRALQCATKGVPNPLPTNYCLSPRRADISDYLDRLRADGGLPIAYDIETEGILGVKEPEGLGDKKIIQIQFSSAVGEALVLPWEGEWIEAARAILATPNLKWGWFDRLFDRKVLRAQGVVINGETHDLIDAWQHLQPSFTSAKDDSNGDKGVPSRLMSLQSCVSFYFPHEGVWKGAVQPPGPGLGGYLGMMSLLRWYGARDADLTFRIGEKLFAALGRGGLYEGYTEYKYRLSAVLDDLTETGLPVDRERQNKLRAYVDSEEASLLRQLQSLVPESLQSLHPEFGYVNVPKDIQAIIDNGYDVNLPPLVELASKHGYLVERMVTAEVINKIEIECVECAGVGTVAGVRKPKKCSKCKATGRRWVKEGRISRDEMRWALALFNPNSHDHIISYLEHMDYPVPLHIDTKRPTTGQSEIESLILDTDDEVLKTIAKLKKLTKLGGTYCGGDWIPKGDGRVHGTFRFGTASGQTSCSAPNQQQWPSHFDPDDLWLVPIMQQVKECIRAEPGHVFVKLDAKGAHSRMQAFLAEDPAFYRLSNLGTHAFNTAHYVDVPDKNELLVMEDVALLARFKEIKKQYDYEYNFAKRVSFNMQYLGGAQKAAHTLRVPVMEVVQLMELIKGLFPKSFIEFPESIRRRLKRTTRLVSAHGSCRWIWDEDVQQAVAFAVANEFHSHWQSGLIRLRETGLTRRFEATNFCHDDVWLHPKEEETDECIALCRAEMEKPSTVLHNSLGAFQVNTEVQIGYDMGNLRDA